MTQRPAPAVTVGASLARANRSAIFVGQRAARIAGLGVAWIIVAACNDPTPAPRAVAQAAFGQCTRDEAVLRGPASACVIDGDCPCGAFCDPVGHACRFQCMVPPASPAEACATGTSCDDTGRCVGPSAPPSNAPVLTAIPAALTTAPGGAARSLQVVLSVFTSTAVATAQATPVRAVASDGAQVSCDNGASYGAACVVTGWTFGFDGAKYDAARPVWVRTIAGTPDGHGQLHLRIDALDANVVVPVEATTLTAGTGDYRGTATRADVPAGLAISATVRGGVLIVRDPTRTLAPSGVVVANAITPATPTPGPRRLRWLLPPGATTGEGLAAEYGPVALTAGAAPDSLTGALRLRLLGVETAWTLQLGRAAAAPACATAAECGAGELCPGEVQVCVPADAWTGPATTANQLDDPDSAKWWNAIDDLLGTGDVAAGGSSEAFATTGADLIESLMCTTTEGTGRLGTAMLGSATQSRSGDLGCVRDSGTNSSPGAVGLATYFDRTGSAQAQALLGTCMADLQRKVQTSFAGNFGTSVGTCANLARVLPALRLLAGGELAKRTAVTTADPRLRGLLRRLVQQWSQLHGFVASTGLAEREFEDAIAADPEAARQNLLALLDLTDRGAGALLDRRVAPAIASAAATGPGSDAELFPAADDYRRAKPPVVYWPFNQGANAGRDLIQSVALVTQRPCIGTLCPEPTEVCRISTTKDSFAQGYNCPGYRATLPATSPSLASGGNLSVVFNLDPYDNELPPYRGGTIVATPTLAVIETWPGGVPMLNLIHPTGAGTIERLTLHVGHLGRTTIESPAGTVKGTGVAIVRDTVAQQYVVHVWSTDEVDGIQSFVQPYAQPVRGTLSGLGANQILVGAGPVRTAPGEWWGTGSPALKLSYAGYLDDVAVFDSMLARRDVVRYGTSRGDVENRRDAWPSDLAIADYGTQELATPVASEILTAQAAALELADRFAVHMRHRAQAACDSGDATARAQVDQAIARLGRAIRQSVAIEHLVRRGTSDSAGAARTLLGAKLSQLARDVDTLASCRNPYGMTASEIPLYFGAISPTADEKGAFFAASDHLLALAEQHTQTAQAALDNVRLRWDQQRQSQIQELQSAAVRDERIHELEVRYGEPLIRLCGISDRTPGQVIADVIAGTFALDACFVKPPSGPPANTCPTARTLGPVLDADPTCYRGALGGALMDMRASYLAQQAAYQSWQAAIGNAAAAEKLCILKEVDAFGCSVLDRANVAGVTCPPDHLGTMELIAKFNDEMAAMERHKGLFDDLIGGLQTMATVLVVNASTGGAAAALTGLAGALTPLSSQMGHSIEDRKREHEAMLQEHALTDDIRTCWNTAEQYQRAIGAAEQASLEGTARMQAAILAFENGLAEAREAIATAPVEIDRELTRPAIPIAFHYWLPEALEIYARAFEAARRYTYLALRATEYDTLDSYAAAVDGKPSRAAVLGAWLPPALATQLERLRAQTSTRQTVSGPPRLGHTAFDLGAKVFGLAESSPAFGATLEQYARPVYSQRGEYLGRGVRFSLVPARADEAPVWRCAERIWRVNLGATGFPTAADGTHVKLLKRNVFASRRCGPVGDQLEFQVASLRPGANLLVAAGDPAAYVAERTSSVADVALVDFNQPDALLHFKTRDDFLNGSSSELALQGLYGDYILLFPASELDGGLALAELRDFFVRFDYLSIDNTPAVQAVVAKPPERASPTPIVVTDAVEVTP